jgi:hypothetical protein
MLEITLKIDKTDYQTIKNLLPIIVDGKIKQKAILLALLTTISSTPTHLQDDKVAALINSINPKICKLLNSKLSELGVSTDIKQINANTRT